MIVGEESQVHANYAVNKQVDIPDSLNSLKPWLWALPTHYKFQLEPLIDDKIVHGSGVISFEVIKTPNVNYKCYLNNINATQINHASINDHVVNFEAPKTKDGVDYSSYVIEYCIPTALKSSITSVGQKFDMKISFSSKIRDDLEGQYLAVSKTEDFGEEKILTTQLESHFARRVFPCVDEPGVKTTFQFEFLVNEGLQVLHNTLPVSIVPDAKTGKILHTFEPTVKLPTYLIAYCVGKFDTVGKTVKNTDGSDILVECIGPRGTKHKIEKTLEHACNIIKELMVYFGKYPLKRVAHVAIPDFAMGAMENMGLITYRDSILNFSEESGLRQKLFCILVIAHELSHTWFGNLVTMKWWNDLWLNESFATITETIVSQSCYEKLGLTHKYNFLEFYLDEMKTEGMKLDSQKSTHPISVPVEKPNDIESLFDSISYNKGSSILHMCMGWMGTEKFYEAVRVYLDKFKYGNAEANDLWETMSEFSKSDINSLMSYWIQNSGFPCVSFKLNGQKLNLSQHQYRSVNLESEKSNKVWPIPLHIIMKSDSGEEFSKKFIFDRKETEFDLPFKGKIQAIKFNKDCHTLMVYDLDDSLSQVLSNNFTFLDQMEQIDFINNLKFLMGSTKQSSLGEVQLMYPKYTVKYILELLNKLNISQSDHAAINTMLSLLSKMLSTAKMCDLEHPGYLDKFNNILSDLVSKYPVPDTSFLQSESYSYVNCQLKLFSMHMHLKTKSVIDKCVEIYANREQTPIHQSLISLVHKVNALESFDEATPDTVIIDYLKQLASIPDSLYRCQSIAGSVAGMPASKTQIIMDFALSKESKMQDMVYFIRSLHEPAKQNNLAIYMDNNKQRIVDIDYPMSSRISLLGSLKYCFTPKQLDTIANMSQCSPEFCCQRVIDETCDFVKANQNSVKIFLEQL